MTHFFPNDHFDDFLLEDIQKMVKSIKVLENNFQIWVLVHSSLYIFEWNEKSPRIWD